MIDRLVIIFLLILLNVQFIHLDFFARKITSANAYDINWEGNNKKNNIKEIEEIKRRKLERKKLERKKIIYIEQQKLIKQHIILKNKETKIKNALIQKELEKNKVYPKNLDITSNFKKNKLQEKSLSCEFAATADILSTLENRIIDEDELIKLSPKQNFNTLPIRKNGKVYWKDPNKGFVGYIDKLPSGKEAKQGLETGYGILEKPIANIYNQFGYITKIITSENYSLNYNQKNHLTELLKAINNGDYVQLWGDYCTSPESEDTEFKNKCYKLNYDRSFTWYYIEDGKEVKHIGLKGEHAFKLLGYKGGVENPTHIIVWDTKSGKHTFNIKEWYRKWNLMQNRSIIIKNK